MFETRTDLVTRRALDGMATRNRTYADNIANVDTPGYTAKKVSFEDQLREVRDGMLSAPQNQERTAQLPFDLQPTPDEDQKAERSDGNTVSIDKQVVQLEKNRLAYEALTQAVRMRYEILRNAINEAPR